MNDDREEVRTRPRSRVVIYLLLIGAVALFLHLTRGDESPPSTSSALPTTSESVAPPAPRSAEPAADAGATSDDAEADARARGVPEGSQ